jgi:hypothetical protein
MIGIGVFRPVALRHQSKFFVIQGYGEVPVPRFQRDVLSDRSGVEMFAKNVFLFVGSQVIAGHAIA